MDGREVVWEAQPRQAVALSCPALELCYGGTKGGGKTDFLVMACVEQMALCHAKYLATKRKQRGRYIIFRKNVKNLADIIQRAEELYPVLDPGAKWNVMEKRWTFTSGYKVDFAHLDGPNDHTGYNGQEITGIGIDQVEEIAEEVYLFLRMQVRSKFEDMRKLLFVRVTANPGGLYAAWVKRYFVEGCKPHNTVIKSTVKLRNGKSKETTKAFVPATLYDNKYLAEDGAYEATLLSLPDHLRRMYLDGDWDVVLGAYFSHVFNRAVHVIRSFPISGHWPIKFGLDWGTSAPSCTLWAARDNDGNIYFIDELYCPGITGRTYGEKMLKKLELQKWSNEKRWGVKDMYGLIDRQAMAATGSDGAGPSTPAAGIQWCGWRIFPANKDRAAGNEQWLERLLMKGDGKPSVYIFGDRCPNLARTIPALMSDPHNPEDVDTTGDDHAYDAGKYLLMDWPVKGTRPTDKTGDQDVERWLSMARQRKEAAEASGDTITTGYGD